MKQVTIKDRWYYPLTDAAAPVKQMRWQSLQA